MAVWTIHIHLRFGIHQPSQNGCIRDRNRIWLTFSDNIPITRPKLIHKFHFPLSYYSLIQQIILPFRRKVSPHFQRPFILRPLFCSRPITTNHCQASPKSHASPSKAGLGWAPLEKGRRDSKHFVPLPGDSCLPMFTRIPDIHQQQQAGHEIHESWLFGLSCFCLRKNRIYMVFPVYQSLSGSNLLGCFGVHPQLHSSWCWPACFSKHRRLWDEFTRFFPRDAVILGGFPHFLKDSPWKILS